MTVIFAVPKAFVAGPSIRVPVFDGLAYVTAGAGTTPGLLEVAVTVRFALEFVDPDEIPVRLIGWGTAFSFMTTSLRMSMVGGLLTGVTVTVNDRMIVLLMAAPSSTITVMMLEP